jgi:hypothetical protein
MIARCPHYDTDEICAVLLDEVFKREVVEGEMAQDAVKRLTRATNRALRAKQRADAPVLAEDVQATSPE